MQILIERKNQNVLSKNCEWGIYGGTKLTRKTEKRSKAKRKENDVAFKSTEKKINDWNERMKSREKDR